MKTVHVELKEANEYVEKHHRHHKKVLSHRFSIGVEKDGELVGVAIVGRPVARGDDWRSTLEVTRLCTDGTRNTCSYLYGAVVRAGKALGYKKVQTFILESENGASLKASNFTMEKKVRGRSWDTPARKRTDKHPTVNKTKWSKII